MKNFNLPKDYRPYIDKYFLRAKEILQKDYLNPVVKYQVFIRKGNCKVYGIDEAIAIFTKYSKKINKIYALKEGSHFDPCETLMTIEAPVQELIDLETMYLGVLSAETTLRNDEIDIVIKDIVNNMGQITYLVGDRPISYFGARHWRYDRDFDISMACMLGGATNCSTDAGAKAWGENQKGIGTIPHSLEAIYHWKYGLEKAVREATMSFDRYIDHKVHRIALVDYANREILDSLDTATKLEKDLYGIRIDTSGENVMEGVFPVCFNKYWSGNGVTISGVASIRHLLNNHGHSYVKIILSSGFGKPKKVKAFIDAEKQAGVNLFDGLGVGGVFESRMATSDIIEVDGQPIHKVGRPHRPNERLERVI